MYRCLNVTAHVDSRFGGLTTTLPRFCHALEATGKWSAPLVAFCRESEVAPPDLRNELEFERFPLGRRLWLARSQWVKRLKEQVRRADVVHIHGLWQQQSAWASKLCRELNRPCVISAHGMLEPWALAQSKWKKRLYLALVESRNLRSSACLRALTVAEREDYRRIGLNNRCAVVPNGIDVRITRDPRQFLLAYPELHGKKLIVFLGRLHQKKGLDVLFDAWNSIAAANSDSYLVIVGPGDAGVSDELISRLRQSSARMRVLFTGMLRGELKWSALAAAHCFVLPSYSEGFSVAVLEALASGIPVLISPSCHFPEVVAANCGWEVSPTLTCMQKALNEALSTPGEDILQMGLAGRRLVEEQYSWGTVAVKTAQMLDECVRRTCE